MNFLRVLCLTATAGISGCLGREVINQRIHSYWNVDAACSPTCPCPQLKSAPRWPCTIPSTDISPAIKHVPLFQHPIFPKRTILEFEDFIGCYDNTTKTPVWTLEHVNCESLKKKCKISPFAELLSDCRIPKAFRSESCDYDCEEKHYKLFVASPTFHASDDYLFLTNVAPHNKDASAGTQNMLTIFNSYVRYLAAFHANVYVCTGSLYLPEERTDRNWYVEYPHIGDSRIAVPTHFFKVIVGENEDGTFRFECFKVKNGPVCGNEDIREFHVSREELEKEAGFEIFDKIECCMIRDRDTHPGFYSARQHCPHYCS